MEQVENQVREYVYSMTERPQNVISERDIAQRFNLKRNNVREIFLSLEGEGILQRMPKVGYKLVDYRGSDLRTIYAIRYAVEREAARKAITRATREDVVRMTLIVEDMEAIFNDSKGSVEDFGKKDMEFHRALVGASHDNMLIKTFSFITMPLFKDATPLKQLGPTHANHKMIVEAIKKADEEALMQLMTRHLGNYEKFK